MKKLIIIIPLIILISGCVVIGEKYRMPGPRVVTVDHYDYYPSYYDWNYGYYYSYPYWGWTGFGWWNPFWYYGFYNFYYGWYYPYYGSYYYYYPSRYYGGKSVVTKNQLRDPNKSGSNVSGRKIRYIDRGSVSGLTRVTSQGKSSRISSVRSSRVRSTRSGSVSRIRSSGSSGRSSVSRTRSTGTRVRSSGSRSSGRRKK